MLFLGDSTHVVVADSTVRSQVFARIDALASKLGVAGAHLWGVLVRQAYVDFVTALMSTVICSIFLLLWWKVVVPRWNGWLDDADDKTLNLMFSGLILVVLTVLLIVSLVNLIHGTGEIVNPEYQAIQTIIGAIKK